MTDEEIVRGLIARDNEITRKFFFGQCQPLFRSIIRFVFSYKVDYDEFVNELYHELIKDDAHKLRSFDYRGSFMGWLKIVAIRHFISKRDELIENVSKELLYEENDVSFDEPINAISNIMDLEWLLRMMSNERYAYVIRKLILEEVSYEDLAEELGTNTANLYNIKKRAMAALTRVALKDIRKYGKE